MPILDATELAELQADMAATFDEIFPDRADISRGTVRTLNADAPDEWTETPEEQLTDVPCKYRAANGRERLVADMPQGTQLWTVTVPAVYKVLRGDQVSVFEKGDEPGFDLSVVAVMKRSNALKCDLICQTVGKGDGVPA